MHRSTATLQPDPHHVVSRAEHAEEVVLDIPTPVNTAYWDRFQPETLHPKDWFDDLYSSSSNNSSSYDYSHQSSEEEVQEMQGEEQEVHLFADVVEAKEGDKELPI
ncbi:hypothetical protein ZWY2020_002355 [Hordeum vulgare]|nr:hypothetical protein ZWY2020_002355 [Hordeum vulgare]